jgi:hypothetical protein
MEIHPGKKLRRFKLIDNMSNPALSATGYLQYWLPSPAKSVSRRQRQPLSDDTLSKLMRALLQSRTDTAAAQAAAW